MSLELAGIHLSYPDGDAAVVALDDVCLKVAAGELLALAGPSGSGKSSLLAVAAGLIRPAAGTVRIGGTEIWELDEAERTRARLDAVGIIFQQPNLIPSLTAAEQLELTAHLRGRSPRAYREEARRLLARVGLEDLDHRRPHQLSLGQRQRVNIARALSAQPEILLVDEPTAALDHDHGTQIVGLLADLTRDYAAATVMATHDAEILTRADRVAYLRDGELA